MSTEKHETWVSPRRFSAEAQIPISTVYRYLHAGKLHHFRHRVTRRFWIDQGEVARWSPELGEVSPEYEFLDRPQGVLPRSYRDDRGNPLPGRNCPRSSLLWGTAGANLLRSIALDRGEKPEAEVIRETRRGDTDVTVHHLLY
jgi:hypothetical protein